jgi:MerR family regulatory protein
MVVRPTEFWCTECRAITVWVLAGQLAAILGVSDRTIHRWHKQGQVHSRKLGKKRSGLRVFCVCSVCGQWGQGPCDGCRVKILCQGVTGHDTLVLAPPTNTTLGVFAGWHASCFAARARASSPTRIERLLPNSRTTNRFQRCQPTAFPFPPP